MTSITISDNRSPTLVMVFSSISLAGRQQRTFSLWRLRLEVENRLPVGGGTIDQLTIGVGLVLGGGGFDLPDAAVMLLSR